MLDKLRNLDRRWVFLAIFMSAFLPMAFNVSLPIANPTEPARQLYEAIDKLPNGSVVLVSFDFEPGSEVELAPAALAMLRHLFSKDCKVVAMSLWPAGSTEARKYLGVITDELKAKGTPKVNGVDWVNLGYKAGKEVTLRQMGSGFSGTFPTDIDGKPIDKIPMMAGVNRYRDVAMALSLTVGDPGLKQWVQVVNTEYGTRIGGAATAVNAPELSPFLVSGQLIGLLGGLRGAADYETLTGYPGTATQGMNIQSFVHLTIMAFIVLSNVIYFNDRRRKRARRSR